MIQFLIDKFRKQPNKQPKITSSLVGCNFVDTSLYTIDMENKTVFSKHTYLDIDFSNLNGWMFDIKGGNCKIRTGDNCVFNITGRDCEFYTGDNCIFNGKDTAFGCDHNWFHTGDNCIFNYIGIVCRVYTSNNCEFKNFRPYSRFKTGNSCTFSTNNGACEFDTGDNCSFKVDAFCNFHTGSNCHFITGDRCLFNTGYDCTFKTGYRCSFETNSRCKFDIDPWGNIRSTIVIRDIVEKMFYERLGESKSVSLKFEKSIYGSDIKIEHLSGIKDYRIFGYPDPNLIYSEWKEFSKELCMAINRYNKTQGTLPYRVSNVNEYGFHLASTCY